MITDLRYKLVRRYPPHAGHFADELFDLENDPRETTNLIDEAALQGVVMGLDQQLEQFYARFAERRHAGTQVTALPAHNRFEPWRAAAISSQP
jgi:hypothetical protein